MVSDETDNELPPSKIRNFDITCNYSSINDDDDA